jgi:hypothetical protein
VKDERHFHVARKVGDDHLRGLEIRRITPSTPRINPVWKRFGQLKNANLRMAAEGQASTWFSRLTLLPFVLAG